MILCHIALVQGDITVISLHTNQTVLPDIPDMPAYFGKKIDDDGIWGQVVYAKPANGCAPIEGPPNKTFDIPEIKWFVLIMRYGCNFSRKVLNAQLAGYDAAIVHNVGSNQLQPMGPDAETPIITIPSVFIGESDGLMIKSLYTYDKEYVLEITPDLPFNLSSYLIPFAVGVGVCLFVMLMILVIKCIRDRRQRQRHRLPTRLLKQLAIKKYRKGDHPDVCAICLDDYVENEKLRVLPCSHTYHSKCIDPWLTESRRTCPVCKRKVFPCSRRNGGTSDSDSDSETEDGGSDRSMPNESTPLLNSGDRNVNRVGVDVLPSTHGLVNPTDVSGETATFLPSSAPSSLASSGGWYASLASVNASPTSAGLHTSAASSDALLTVPVLVSGNDLLSSGEHSLNGDYSEYSSLENSRPIFGPVEIAVDVARRSAPGSSPNVSSSLPSTSMLQAVHQGATPSTSSRSRSPKFLRGIRNKRKRRSSLDDTDAVV